jgi:predicted  nucleic acid-binding Zn-ribbon protein
MSENVDNLILKHLREIRDDLGALRKDVTEIKEDMSDVDQKVDGMAIMLTMLAGHVHHIEERVEALEEAPKP